MGNQFYHDITLSFNAWFIVAPSMVVLMMLSGIFKYKLSRESLKILKRDPEDYLLNMICVGLDAILLLMVVLESSDGLIQYGLNHLDSSTDPVWIPFIISVELIVAAVVVWATFFIAGKFGQFLRYNYLKDKRRRMRKKGA